MDGGLYHRSEQKQAQIGGSFTVEEISKRALRYYLCLAVHTYRHFIRRSHIDGRANVIVAGVGNNRYARDNTRTDGGHVI